MASESKISGEIAKTRRTWLIQVHTPADGNYSIDYHRTLIVTLPDGSSVAENMPPIQRAYKAVEDTVIDPKVPGLPPLPIKALAAYLAAAGDQFDVQE